MMKIKHIPAFVGLLLMSMGLVLHAQDPQPDQSGLSDTINLHPVTIIALRQTFQIENLDLDYMDYMAHDAGALLNQTSGINSIRKSGSYGFDPVFRGFKYDQLNIVLNGAQCATAACPNRMDPATSQMAPNMIDRIEILKGPHALRYGGAFGGTINFLPASLRFSDHLTNYGRFSGGYDSNGNILRSEGLVGLSGKRYDLGIYASWSQGNDYTAGDGSTVKASFQRGSFGGNLGLKLSDNQQLRFSATRNLARDTDFPTLPMDLRKDDTWMFNARHDISIYGGNLHSWNTTLFGSFVHHVMDNLLKPLDPRAVNAETVASTNNYGGRTEGVWSFKNGKMFAGGDIKIEGAQGIRDREFLMGPNSGKIVSDNAWQNSQITKTGLFTEYRHQKQSIQWVFSGRLELNISDTSDPEPEFTDLYPETEAFQINPSISIGAVKKLKKSTSMGLWVGRAQRSGGLIERFINYFPVGQDPYEMLGNPQLDPEVNNQIDITFQWHHSNTTVNVDLFTSYMQDFISSSIDATLIPRLPMSPGVRQFVNIDHAFKTGFEVAWSQKLFAGLQHQFNMAYTYAQDLVLDEPLPEIAPLDLRYHLIGIHLKNRLRSEIGLRHVLEQSRISNEFGETVTPSFTILDVNISYQFHRLFGIKAGIHNLFNEVYYEHLSRSVKGSLPQPLYAPGRNFSISFNLNF
ncbi:MAG: TonB-dependent receptor [Bacteroidota bacterium]